MAKEPSTNSLKTNATKTILLTGFIVGLLDAVAASINYIIRTGNNPVRVFRFIASGVFGKEAFRGGLPMAAIGLLFHFMIAFAFTLLFYFAYPRLKVLSRNLIITGLAYGIFIWLIMNEIVIPISNTPKFPFNLIQTIVGIFILMLLVGIPISLFIGRFYSRKQTSITEE